MIVLGVDPGLVNTGWGVDSLEKITTGEQIKAYGCITTKSNCLLPERLGVIYKSLTQIIKKYKPDTMAVEKIFYAKNVKTTLLLGHARGIVLLTGCQAGLSIGEYTALQVKQSLIGYGRAEKVQIQNMLKNLLKLKEVPRPDDASDAIAVAICHLNSSKYLQITNKAGF